MEKPYFGNTSRIFLRRDVVVLSRNRFGSFAAMLKAKAAAGRQAPKKMSQTFLNKVWCDAEYGGSCTCGQHENFTGGNYCEGCGGYHDY